MHSPIGGRPRSIPPCVVGSTTCRESIPHAVGYATVRRLFCCCGHGFVAVHDLVLWSLFADGAYPITCFFIAAWVLFERVNGQGKTDICGRYCGRLRVAAARYRGKDLVLLRMGQSIRQCR